jgi:hypothetical protein
VNNTVSAVTSEIAEQQQQTPVLVAMVPDRESTNRQIFREFIGDHKLMRPDGAFAGPANLVPFWQVWAADKIDDRNAFPFWFFQEGEGLWIDGIHCPRLTRSSKT